MNRPLIGISSCLLGEAVRYNGQHKLDRFLVDTLGKFVDYVPVCPEVECGMPVPRPAMRLVGNTDSPRLLTRDSGADMTDKMMSWIPGKLNELEKKKLCGFIFKARSPSSGMERVKVYNGHGGLSGRAPGMFAKEFMKRFPTLPAEDDGRLHDPDLRENFIERIFTLNRYRDSVAGSGSPAALVKFQEHNKLLLMSHSAPLCTRLGRMVASARDKTSIDEYEKMLLRCLRLPATVAKHTNVLQHIMGYFKKVLSPDEKKELLDVIGSFQKGNTPLIVPITLLNHYVRKYHVAYLAGQCYLNPHPAELKLRNHS
ncbi:MAG: DUF1722 domain-containing protein [Lentisphaerales bacterium]|nr:MAG: DUF1722 domain-containing protein [Lentisphaerales bacterium]